MCECVCVVGDRGLLQLCNEDFGPLSLVVGFDNMGVLCLSHNTLYVRGITNVHGTCSIPSLLAITLYKNARGMRKCSSARMWHPADP